jgi:hypothetical protein
MDEGREEWMKGGREGGRDERFLPQTSVTFYLGQFYKTLQSMFYLRTHVPLIPFS